MDEELRRLERLAEQDSTLRPSYLGALKRSGNAAYPKELIRYSSDLVLEAIDTITHQFTYTPQCIVLDRCNEESSYVIKAHLHPPNPVCCSELSRLRIIDGWAAGEYQRTFSILAFSTRELHSLSYTGYWSQHRRLIEPKSPEYVARVALIYDDLQATAAAFKSANVTSRPCISINSYEREPRYRTKEKTHNGFFSNRGMLP